MSSNGKITWSCHKYRQVGKMPEIQLSNYLLEPSPNRKAFPNLWWTPDYDIIIAFAYMH